MQTSAEPVQPASSPTLTFVGRAGELAVLWGALAQAKAAHGQVVLVSGEAGVGKTALALEVAALAGERRALMLWGQCDDGPGAPALWPWLQVLRSARDEVGLQLDGAAAAPLADLLRGGPGRRRRHGTWRGRSIPARAGARRCALPTGRPADPARRDRRHALGRSRVADAGSVTETSAAAGAGPAVPDRRNERRQLARRGHPRPGLPGALPNVFGIALGVLLMARAGVAVLVAVNRRRVTT